MPLDCPQTSPCNTGSCCCSQLHRRDCPIPQVSTRRDIITSELHSGVVATGYRAGVTDTSRYWREPAALPGWKLRGLQQVGVVSVCRGKELGSGVQVDSMESGSQMAQHTEQGQNPVQAARNVAIGQRQLPLPEPNSAATITFGLLMIPCQIKLEVPRFHRNTKCHVLSVFCLMCISPYFIFLWTNHKIHTL